MAGGLAGLAFVPQGYDQGGLQFEQLQAAQTQNQGLAALGKALQGMYGAGGGGAAPSANPIISAIQGLTAGGGAGPGPTTPTSPSPGQPTPPGLSPPPAGTGAAPQLPGATQVAGGAPSPQGGPPGQAPQPARPPGLASGGGGGPAAGAVTPQQPGYGLPLGTMSWQDLARRIVQANPGASPQVIAAAMTKALPLLNADSQQAWKQIELELQRERLHYLEGQGAARERIAGMKPDVAAMQRFIQDNPNATAEEYARFAQSLKSGGRAQSAAALTFQKYFEEHPDATIEDFQTFANAPSTRRSIEKEEAGLARQREHDQAITERQERTQQAITARQSRSIEAAGERQERTITHQDARAAAAESGRNTRAATRATEKTEGARQTAESIHQQILSVIGDIDESQHGGTPVTGIQGRAQRWLEWGQGLIGDTHETRAQQFETKIRALQAQIPRALAGVGRISNEERANIDRIVRGLGSFTDPEGAINSLHELDHILASKAPKGAIGSGGGAGEAHPNVIDTVTKALKGRGDIDLNISVDGERQTWRLDENGQPVRVK